MTRPVPPRLASWVLQRFAYGPQCESLIGDIVEQYSQGRSSTWYLRQTLATVLVGAAARVRLHPRPLFRAVVLAMSVAVFFAKGGWWVMLDVRGDNWLTVFLNLGVFGYCAMGVVVLMLTITCLDEPVSLSLDEPTRS